MRQLSSRVAPSLIICLLAASTIASAQTSTYSSMAIAGTFNNHSATPNMVLVSNNTWRGTAFVISHTNALMFVANGVWAAHWWGETNQTSHIPPFTGIAEKNPSITRKILMTNSPLSSYEFTFNDSTYEYAVVVSTNPPPPIVAAAGTFNNSNSIPNMELIGDNIWQGDFYISASSGRFKFSVNNWQVRVGDTNQVGYILPISGTGEIVGAGHDIVYSNAIPGYYRITLDNTTLAYSMRLLYSETSGVNLIQNSSFEVAGNHDLGERARHWQWGVPDTHGDIWAIHYWSRAKRKTDWRRRSGTAQATLCAKWSPPDDDFGGWWQEGPAEPGYTYQGSAWFWADPEWTAGNQEMKVEFYDTNFVLLGVSAMNYTATNTHWTRNKVLGVAPENTAWARIVIAMSGAGTQGAMQFDDVELRRISTRTQDFDRWGAFSTDQCHELDDWLLCTGQVVSVLVEAGVTQQLSRSGYAASIANAAASTNHGGYIRTPLYEDGVGIIRFWYRNGFTGDENNMTTADVVGFRVQTSLDGSTWTTVGGVTNVLSLSYTEYATFLYLPSPAYVRIQHAGGSTNRLFIDNIFIEEPQRISRYMDFNTWPDAGTNIGNHLYLGWRVHTGIVSTANAFHGKSLHLPHGGLSFTNFVQSPFFASGYGIISFRYARDTNGTAPARLLMQSSTDGANWTTLDTISNITSTAYLPYERFFYQPAGSYVRICNITNPPVPPSNILLDEEFFGGSTPPAGWSFTGIGIYETTGNFGRNSPSLRFDDTNDRVVTPVVSNPTNLSFWTRGQSINTGSVLSVEGLVGVSWITVTNIANIGNTAQTRNMPVSSSMTQFRFTYTKAGGNLSFDDVIITGVPVSPSTAPQSLMLDNINIAPAYPPEIWRSQNFDTWPSENSYGNYQHQGWSVVNAIIEMADAYAGQAVRLNRGTSGERSITSPYFADGLGTVTFRYRHWDGGAPAVNYALQVSTNETHWTTLDTITITSATYQTYSKYYYITNSVRSRLFWLSGDRQVRFDEITMHEPRPQPSVNLSVWTDPQSPFSNDWVTIKAVVAPLNSAEILAVNGYYRIGTSGAFTALSMQLENHVFYNSAVQIPPQPSGTIVQYYVRVDFDGVGVTTNSPMFYPSGGSNSPAWYGIPRAPAGQVWINEICYIGNFDLTWGMDTQEFVEVCGPAGLDISDWTLELHYGGHITITSLYYETYAHYRFPPNTVLTDMTNGYGFFVLGDTGWGALADINFTNFTKYDPLGEWDDNLADGYPDGIRLLNEVGGIEYSLSYSGPMPGFNRIPPSQYDTASYSLNLAGVGSNYADFAWTLTNYTPRTINPGQTLVPQGEPPEPPVPPDSVEIVRFVYGTNLIIFTAGNTNASPWAVAPYWTQNLRAEPQDWQPLTPFTSTYEGGGSNRIWFNLPTATTNRIFRIMFSAP